MVGVHAFLLWSVRGRVGKGDPDFTAFYTAGKILREGRSAKLYDAATQDAVQWEFASNRDIRRGPLPYVCPPFEALLFVPLTFLPYTHAFVVWNCVNLGVLFAIAALLRRAAHSLGHVPLWEWMLALLAFFPVFINFLQGQDAILLLLTFVLGFRALDRDAQFAAGCWLGLAVFKFHLVIPLILILAVWKGGRLVLGFTATASAATLLSLGIVGWRGALRYTSYAWHIVSAPGHGQTPLGLVSNFVGLATGWPFVGNAAWILRWVAIVASVVLLIAVARMGGWANDARFFRLSFACAVITTLLVAYLTNTHDLCLLLLPLALLADHCAGHWCERSAMRALLIPVAPLLVSPLWMLFWLRWGRLNLVVIPLLWWIYAMRREILRLSRAKTSGGAALTSSA
ncbi:MAG TPA: glycosyltransferase family 87 protein [Candidatus Acidoferrales bacterium]|nr:glycosyltransferase family 87 protein [Candidatus Acidoferrales bacterium]